MLNIGRQPLISTFSVHLFDFVQIDFTQNEAKSINNEKSINQVAKNNYK